ncbi:MAG: hypothetical protein J6Q84_06675 [Kiritimatiellae bacterium]|nr:hypothetical protein [Kiritimatiellia bacterium]
MDPIKLTQGDDLNAFGQEYNFVLSTEADLTGWKAVFELDGYQQVWSDITSKKLSLEIPAKFSKCIKAGRQFGALKIYDQNGLCKTVKKDIEFIIEPEVVKSWQS